ncbi:hypothetical protein QBC44DRAFT_371789 [Cladorrhinum sp. PSN332]|nr:hypothetical protein QBC44DRAFT_371789 [Cladorrhinum sp. PSN332]
MSSTAQSSGRPGASSASPSRPSGTSFAVDTWVLVNGDNYSKAGAPPPKRDNAKKFNHIICIDGTSNNQTHDKTINEGQVTNVGRISHLFPPATQDGRIQQVLYQPGIGSVSDYSTPALRLMDNMIDQGVGGDFAKFILSLYRYLSTVYRQGDQLFIFGFSRGAYIARILSSLIADVGVFDRKQQKASQGECDATITDIVNQWKLRKGGQADKAYANFMQPAKVDFLGLFDTVAALGLPDFGNVDLQCQDYRFAEQIDKRPRIRRAFQAIALSERRENFKCILFTKRHEKQVINQVWFPGSHESIGGGNGDTGNTVPYVTLIWMVSKFRSLVDVDQTKLEAYVAPPTGHVPCGDVADSRSGIWLANTSEYRTSLGTGVNEKRHITTEQPYFTQFTGIAQMPDVDGSDQKPIRLEKLAKEKPEEWEQSMLNLLDKHVDGVPGYFEGKLHHLKHHTLHGISHAPNLTSNGPYEGSASSSSARMVQRVQTRTTQTVQVQKAVTPTGKRVLASAGPGTAKTPQKSVEPVRRVQTGLRQAGQQQKQKQEPEGMRRVQTLTLPVRGGQTTPGQILTQKVAVGGKAVSSSTTVVAESNSGGVMQSEKRVNVVKNAAVLDSMARETK